MSYLHDIRKIQEKIAQAESQVALYYRIDGSNFYDKTRSRENTQARFAVWYILNKINFISCAQIAKHYGYDHTTVLHGVKRAIQENIPKEMGLV